MPMLKTWRPPYSYGRLIDFVPLAACDVSHGRSGAPPSSSTHTTSVDGIVGAAACGGMQPLPLRPMWSYHTRPLTFVSVSVPLACSSNCHRANGLSKGCPVPGAGSGPMLTAPAGSSPFAAPQYAKALRPVLSQPLTLICVGGAHGSSRSEAHTSELQSR